jgi:hypothetical protein
MQVAQQIMNFMSFLIECWKGLEKGIGRSPLMHHLDKRAIKAHSLDHIAVQNPQTYAKFFLHEF